jgi:hypothetical protein
VCLILHARRTACSIMYGSSGLCASASTALLLLDLPLDVLPSGNLQATCVFPAYGWLCHASPALCLQRCRSLARRASDAAGPASMCVVSHHHPCQSVSHQRASMAVSINAHLCVFSVINMHLPHAIICNPSPARYAANISFCLWCCSFRLLR